MAAYSKTEATAAVRSILNEPAARIFTTTQIEHWLDLGAKLVSQLTLCYEHEEEETLVTNQTLYALGDNFYAVEAVTYYDGAVAAAADEYGLQRIAPQGFGHVRVATTDAPAFYFIWAQSLYIYPAPIVGNNGHKIVVRGYSAYDQYGANASENLPDAIQYLAVLMAVSHAYTKLGKHRAAGNKMQEAMQKCYAWYRQVHGLNEMTDSHDMFKLPDRTQVVG